MELGKRLQKYKYEDKKEMAMARKAKALHGTGVQGHSGAEDGRQGDVKVRKGCEDA